jgi:hypothetical protein
MKSISALLFVLVTLLSCKNTDELVRTKNEEKTVYENANFRLVVTHSKSNEKEHVNSILLVSKPSSDTIIDAETFEYCRLIERKNSIEIQLSENFYNENTHNWELMEWFSVHIPKNGIQLRSYLNKRFKRTPHEIAQTKQAYKTMLCDTNFIQHWIDKEIDQNLVERMETNLFIAVLNGDVKALALFNEFDSVFNLDGASSETYGMTLDNITMVNKCSKF